MIMRKKLSFTPVLTFIDRDRVIRTKPGEPPVLFASRSFTDAERSLRETSPSRGPMYGDDGPAIRALLRHEPVKNRDGSPVRLWRSNTLYLRNMDLHIVTHTAEIREGLWTLEAEGRLDRLNTEFTLHEDGASEIHDSFEFPHWWDIADEIRWGQRSHRDYRIILDATVV